ncbi:MAG TPA: trypsin-like serine protease [Acidimicrobiales bacterium]|nr:trypsin-like serine protease [Acidimicrobiales bacterium]
MRRLILCAILISCVAVARPDPVGAIHGGTPSSKPWVVSLVNGTPTQGTPDSIRRYVCSGVLVHRSYVLTARHCLRDISKAGTKVVIGRRDVRSGGQGQVRAIKHIYPMPEYATASSASGIYAVSSDLALLQLSTPSTLPALPLADSSVTGDWGPGKDIRVYGYGPTAGGGAPSRYQRQAVFRINTFSPWRPTGLSRSFRAHHFFTATWTGRHVCPGDSGGPAVKKTAKGERLVGITSATYSYACDGSRGAIYMKVGSRGSLASSPGYVWVRRCIANTATCSGYPR